MYDATKVHSQGHVDDHGRPTTRLCTCREVIVLEQGGERSTLTVDEARQLACELLYLSGQARRPV